MSPFLLELLPFVAVLSAIFVITAVNPILAVLFSDSCFHYRLSLPSSSGTNLSSPKLPHHIRRSYCHTLFIRNNDARYQAG